MSQENDNIPNSVKVFMTVFNRLGFPVMVCLWLAYQQFITAKETIKALDDFKAVMVEVKNSIDQQTRILRHTDRQNE